MSFIFHPNLIFVMILFFTSLQVVCLDEINNYVEIVLIACMACTDFDCRKHDTGYSRTNVSIYAQRERRSEDDMMEDDWFLPYIGGQPLQKFLEYHMEEAKTAPSNLQTDHKKADTTPQIFQTKLQRIVFLCLCYGQALCWVSVQCKFSHFLGGFAVLQISTSSLLCTGDLGWHGEASCYRDHSTHFKTIIKKANGFQECCLQVSSKKRRAVL